MVFTISNSTNKSDYPLNGNALLVPTGYAKNPEAFETTAVEVLDYLRAKNFDIEILSTPETFSTIELNSNLKRLGKFVVRDVALPIFIGVMINFISDNYQSASLIEDDPISLTISIEVVDSVKNTIEKRIDFEGSAEEFNEISGKIESIFNNAD